MRKGSTANQSVEIRIKETISILLEARDFFAFMSKSIMHGIKFSKIYL
jgi:hypothetical protein